jgi:hypothetical protein
MSFDINIQRTCNHSVYRELVTLESDRRSIRLSKHLAAAALKLFASNVLVPSNAYIIIDDPVTINVTRPRMISLRNKWKATEDYWEATYYTLSRLCPKCVGRNFLDDIQYNVKGDFLKIRDENLLLQNLEKFTVTELQSNPFHTFIGTTLVKMLGSRITDSAFITNKITQQISTALNVLKSLQEQYVVTGRAVTQGELLDIVENIVVRIDDQDPTILRADVTARAKSGKIANYSQFLQL